MEQRPMTAGNCQNLTADERDELRVFIRDLNGDIEVAELLGHVAIADALKESRRLARRDLRQV